MVTNLICTKITAHDKQIIALRYFACSRYALRSYTTDTNRIARVAADGFAFYEVSFEMHQSKFNNLGRAQ